MTPTINMVLPCPFCGHQAEIGRVGFTDRYAVICGNEECPVETQATAGNLDAAIALWNTREERPRFDA